MDPRVEKLILATGFQFDDQCKFWQATAMEVWLKAKWHRQSRVLLQLYFAALSVSTDSVLARSNKQWHRTPCARCWRHFGTGLGDQIIRARSGWSDAVQDLRRALMPGLRRLLVPIAYMYFP